MLRQAQTLVSAGWCQNAEARDRSDRPVDPWDEQATSWSLLGAIVAVLEAEAKTRGELPLDELAAALYALADLVDTDSLVAWNDASGRTHADAVHVLGTAAATYCAPPLRANAN